LRTERTLGASLALALIVAGLGCSQDMANQPKYKPQGVGKFFDDGRADRPRVAHTVARGEVVPDDSFHTGRAGGAYLREPPVPVTLELMLRGQERYDVYCSVCHDRVGRGDGMIVRRGFRRPPSFHTDRLRDEPAGYFFDAITNGFGVMPSYEGSIPAADRWAIIAYIRALQRSQHARLEDVPPEERAKLEGAAP
jgi:mono/diheme cytochrome c family protein